MQIVEDKHVIDVKRMWICPAMCWEEIPLCQYSFMILCYMQGTEVTAQACQWYENWLNAFVRTPVAYEKSEVCTWVTRFTCCEDLILNMLSGTCIYRIVGFCCSIDVVIRNHSIRQCALERPPLTHCVFVCMCVELARVKFKRNAVCNRTFPFLRRWLNSELSMNGVGVGPAPLFVKGHHVRGGVLIRLVIPS